MKTSKTQTASNVEKQDFSPASVAKARRSKGMTQSALAEKIACKQSAISMFERGNLQALSQERQEDLATFLELDWPPVDANHPYSSVSRPVSPGSYCPHYDCPSNYPYRVGTRLLAMPRNHTLSSGKHCRYCGEVQESCCPNCSAPYQHGAYCTTCSTPYIFIAQTERSPDEWDQWLCNQQKLLAQMPS